MRAIVSASAAGSATARLQLTPSASRSSSVVCRLAGSAIATWTRLSPRNRTGIVWCCVGEPFLDEGSRARVDVDLREVDELEPELLGDRLCNRS